jgi:phage I-like protein
LINRFPDFERQSSMNAIRLDQTTAANSAPTWVQVARAGNFKGYGGGGFTFDRATFERIVGNFHRHPAYARGASDVVPWDFHHASEANPSDVATVGAPAQGWVRELEVRQGQGGAELWALTRWLEPARSYIKAGRYRWASVVVDFGARDPESGDKLGPTLVSVAITNNPFIEGMSPLVAADKRGQVLRALNDEDMSSEQLDRRLAAIAPDPDSPAVFRPRISAAAALYGVADPYAMQAATATSTSGPARVAASNDARILGTLRRTGPSSTRSARIQCSTRLDGSVFDLPERLDYTTIRENLQGMVGLDGAPLSEAELNERLMALLDLLQEMGIAELQRRSAHGPLILASAYGGRNRTEAVTRMLLATRPEMRRLDYDALHIEAAKFLREHGPERVV